MGYAASYEALELSQRVKVMREEKEIREALKRLKDEHLRRIRQPGDSSIYAMLTLVTMIDALEWVLGDREKLPDFAYKRLAIISD